MKDCCWNNLDNYKKIGRANFRCPICNDDVTLAVVLLWNHEELEKKAKENKNLKKLSK